MNINFIKTLFDNIACQYTKLFLCFWCILDVDSPCAEFDQGTSLHIAASNLSVEAVKIHRLMAGRDNMLSFNSLDVFQMLIVRVLNLIRELHCI